MKVGDPVTYVLRRYSGGVVVRHGCVVDLHDNIVMFRHGTSERIFIGDWTGVRWIAGHHDEDSTAVKALLTAFALAQPP